MAAALTGAALGSRKTEAKARVRRQRRTVRAQAQCRGEGQICEGGAEKCCGGLVCNGLENPTRCRACGLKGQLCCAGPACTAPFVCVNNTCVVDTGGGGGGGGGAVVGRCTSDADCPGGFCNTHNRCSASASRACKNCRSGETPQQCCNRSVKKGCKRKQQTSHAKKNCLKKGKKRCRNLLAGIVERHNSPAVLAGAPSSAGTAPPCAVPRVALGSGSWRRRWDRAIPVDREEGQRRDAHRALWNIGNSDDPGTDDDTGSPAPR